MTQDSNSKLKSDKKIRWTFLLVSIGLFLTSLTQDAYRTHQNSDSFTIFLFGTLALPLGLGAGCISGIAWWANPLLFLSWILIKNTKISYKLRLISTLLAASFLIFRGVIDNEAGHCNTVTSNKLGYWLWLLSSLTMLIGNRTINQNQRTADT